MEENPDELEIQKLYENLRIENNICKYALIAQQDNIRYELSNNNEFDNGIIKSQKEEDIEKQNQEIKKGYLYKEIIEHFLNFFLFSINNMWQWHNLFYSFLCN